MRLNRQGAAALNKKPIRIKKCLFKEIKPAGGLVVNLETYVYYTLNHASARILRLSNGKRTVRGIIKTIAASCSVKQEKITADMIAHIAQLEKAKLIRWAR